MGNEKSTSIEAEFKEKYKIITEYNSKSKSKRDEYQKITSAISKIASSTLNAFHGDFWEIVNFIFSTETEDVLDQVVKIQSQISKVDYKIDRKVVSEWRSQIISSLPFLKDYYEFKDKESFKTFFQMAVPNLRQLKEYMVANTPNPALMNSLALLCIFLETPLEWIKAEKTIIHFYEDWLKAIDECKTSLLSEQKRVYEYLKDNIKTASYYGLENYTPNMGRPAFEDIWNGVTVRVQSKQSCLTCKISWMPHQHKEDLTKVEEYVKQTYLLEFLKTDCKPTLDYVGRNHDLE